MQALNIVYESSCSPPWLKFFELAGSVTPWAATGRGAIRALAGTVHRHSAGSIDDTLVSLL
jgi:hypothetical protein